MLLYLRIWEGSLSTSSSFSASLSVSISGRLMVTCAARGQGTCVLGTLQGGFGLGA